MSSHPNEPTLFNVTEQALPKRLPEPPAGPKALPEPSPGAAVPFDVALLALGSIRGLGSKGLKRLVGAYQDDLGRFLAHPRAQMAEELEARKVAGAQKLAEAIAKDVPGLLNTAEASRQELARRKIVVVPPSQLPDRLRAIKPDPPQWLFVEGDAGLLQHRPVVAVVGTRTPTAEGLRAAGFVTQILAPYPVLLVSGLAEGIDDEAHRSSLSAGVRNLAFLGHGINVVFPRTTTGTRERMVRSGGAVVSEYLPDEHYQKRYFVERNRLQAALADVVIPVEANPTGGTAHTVRFARQYGRQLVGVQWDGANGIIEELRKEAHPVLDIMSPAGWRQLEAIIGDLVEKSGHYPPLLARIEQRLLKELGAGNVRPEDVRRMFRNLEDRIAGSGHEPQQQGNHLRPHDPVRE